MTSGLTVVLAGDTSINARVSANPDPGFQSLVERFQAADVAFTHVEGTIHDYEGPELYAAAEGGWVWMRSAPYAGEELRRMGFDVVSLASNHSLDYSYGGMRATWAALDAAGVARAGTGDDLAAARAPAIVDTPKGRVAVISASSTFPMWARAGERRRDFPGRPGLNPLRHHFVADPLTAARAREAAAAMGWWVTVAGEQTVINPPGIHNTYWRLREADVDGLTTAPDEDDLDGHVRAVREAREHADIVMVQLHNHEWDNVSNAISEPAAFVQPFARACIDAGAQVVVAQGSHAPVRGVEVYGGCLILYDPGDLFKQGRLILRQPDDFYQRPDYDAAARAWTATPSLGLVANATAYRPANPRPAYGSSPGMFIAVCRFHPDFALRDVELLPIGHLAEPRGSRGVPAPQHGAEAEATLAHVAGLSKRYGTRIEVADGRGRVTVAPD